MDINNEVSYADIDIYGRGFDIVFGKGAEHRAKKNALLQLKAERDSKMLLNGNDFIEYDLYGRADPRIFGPDAHNINAESAAEASKSKRNRMLRKKSLRAILFPFGRNRKGNGIFNRNVSNEADPKENEVKQHLEPIDDSPRQVRKEILSSERRPNATPASVPHVEKSLDFDKGADAIVDVSAPDVIVDNEQDSNEFDDFGIASVAEVSSPEVSDVGTSNSSSQSDAPQSNVFSKLAQERATGTSTSHLKTEKTLPTDFVRHHSNSQLLQNDTCNDPSDLVIPTTGSSSRPRDQAMSSDSSSDVCMPHPNLKSAYATLSSHFPRMLTPEVNSTSASSSSSLGIGGVRVTDVDDSDSQSNSLDKSVASDECSLTNSGSFAIGNNESVSGLNPEIVEDLLDVDKSVGDQGVHLAHLFGGGSADSSDSDASSSRPSIALNTNSEDDCEPQVIVKDVFLDPVGVDSNNETLRNELNETSVPVSADGDVVWIGRARSGAEAAVLSRQQTGNPLHMQYDREGARNSSFVIENGTDDADKDTIKQQGEDEYVAEEAVPAHYDSDDTEDDFVDALDSIQDSDKSGAAASSSEVVSSSVYSTEEDSDELESSEQASGELSHFENGSSNSLSKRSSSSNPSDFSGRLFESSRSLGGSSTANPQDLSGSPPVSSAAASKQSSDKTESSFYSQVFASTVVDEDDNSDIFLLALNTPHEELQL